MWGFANRISTLTHTQLASYGFIVVAPFSCDSGCKDKTHDARWTSCLPGLPPVGGEAWAPWYAEGFKAIDWARNMSANVSAAPIFHHVNWAAGVGLVGHSMGGQVRTHAGNLKPRKRS